MHLRRSIPVISLALLMAACVPIPPTPATGLSPAPATIPPAPAIASPAPTSSNGSQLASLATEAQLQNGQYELPDIGSFQLKDGKFQEQTGQGATQVTTAGIDVTVSGDLNGDGMQDAVADVWANTGGTGTFHYLVALLNKDGALQQVASTVLGDRVRLNRLGIEPNGTIVVDFLGFGPNDALCCPSQPLLRTYQLEGSALKMLSEIPPMPTP